MNAQTERIFGLCAKLRRAEARRAKAAREKRDALAELYALGGGVRRVGREWRGQKNRPPLREGRQDARSEAQQRKPTPPQARGQAGRGGEVKAAMAEYRAALAAFPSVGGGGHAWVEQTARLAAAAGVPAVRALVEISLAMSRPPSPVGEVGYTVARTYWQAAAFVLGVDDMLFAELYAFHAELEWLRVHGTEEGEA